MKIKNIIPIFMALFVVACSTAGNNNSPPIDVTTLERLPLSDFDAILEGEVRARVNNPALLTGENLRIYSSTDGFGNGRVFGDIAFTVGNANLRPILANVYTNDLVEKLYIKVDNTGKALSWAHLSATVGRGMFPVRGTSVPLANEIVQLNLDQVTELTEVTPIPDIRVNAVSATPLFTVPSGYRLYTLGGTSTRTTKDSRKLGGSGNFGNYIKIGDGTAFLIRVTAESVDVARLVIAGGNYALELSGGSVSDFEVQTFGTRVTDSE